MRGALAAAALVAALVALFYYPVASVLASGLSDGAGRPTLERISSLAADPYTRRVIAFTVAQAAASTVLAVALGLPGAWLLACFQFRGKRLVRALTTIPFVLPSILVVLGFVLFFGNSGVLNRLLGTLLGTREPVLRILYSAPAILLAHAFYNFPVCMRLVSSLWERTGVRMTEVARSLGARGLKLFVGITLPQILPAILASAALIFLFCFLSFAVILALGGGPRYTTIEVEIYRLARLEVDLPRASALALVSVTASLALLAVQIHWERRFAFAQHLGFQPTPRRLGSPWARAAVAVYLALLAVIVVGPLAAVVAYSLLERSSWGGGLQLTLRWYAHLLLGEPTRFGGSYRQAVATSVGVGLASAALALALGTAVARLLARSRARGAAAVQAALMTPMAVSGVVLGLAYARLSLHLPRGHGAGLLPLILAHAVVSYPFVARTVSGVLAKIRPALLEAARTLGAGAGRTLAYVELPLARSGLATGAAFAFALSLGEINATFLLAPPGTVTIPIAIYRLIGAYNYYAASAMGTVLMLAAFGVFWLLERTAPEAL